VRTVAALFVAKGGCYFGLPDVDPWDEERDARKYAGPHPVVAHPPCARWCQLAGLVEHRWGHKRGDDGGCFASALASVQRWGGVLEHPAFSRAWDRYGLLAPSGRGWKRSLLDGAWVCEVSQRAYGHRARKLTWLYYVGPEPPLELDWARPVPIARLSWCENHGVSRVEIMGKRERSATPPAFRDVLLSIARSAGKTPVARESADEDVSTCPPGMAASPADSCASVRSIAAYVDEDGPEMVSGSFSNFIRRDGGWAA